MEVARQVTPYTGVWIETHDSLVRLLPVNRHPLYGGVD